MLIRREIKMMKRILVLFALVATCTMLSGCAQKQEEFVPPPQVNEEASQPVNVPDEEGNSTAELSIEDELSSKMVSYDVTSVGRSDPFMPYGELTAYNEAESASLAEANRYNASLAKVRNLKNYAVREADDISPYSFNLPVPPTSLAGAETAAAKITRTKVVGIMYNPNSPTAIINVDDKDYLVRQGDKIIGQEYKVLKINPSWITVSLGSNVYSAAIGELFSKDELNKNRNDLYNLENRFGGRKG